MIIRLFFIFLSLLIIGCSGGKNLTTVEVDGQRTEVLSKVAKGDSTVVKMTSYHENGQVSVMRPFKKGVPHGKWQWLGEQGSRDTVRVYKDSLLDGKSRAWHPNGVFLFEQIFKGGHRVGTWRIWYDDETLRSLSEYANNELNGVHVTWYSSGVVASLTEYENGKKNGTFSEWTPKGRIVSNEIYIDDIPHILIKWHDSGELNSATAFRNGKKEWLLKWDRHGRRISESLHKKHTIHRVRFQNGNRQIEADFIDDKKHGAELQWHQNGLLAVVQFYVRNRIIYERVYDKKGGFKHETVSVKGEPIWTRKKEPKIPS